MLLRQLPRYDLQRLRICSRRSRWLRQRSRHLTSSFVANKTSDAIAVTVNPVAPVTVVFPVGR
jgi:hypothetical protein